MPTVIVLLIIGCLSIFWLQNPQKLALIFFGSPTSIQLSLGTWVLIFAAAGAISSLLIQLLAKGGSSFKSDRKTQGYKPPSEPENRPPRRPLERDWENTEDEEWEIETPPKSPSIPTPPREDSIPKPQLRQPSVYSYTPPPQSKEEPVKPPVDTYHSPSETKEEPVKPPVDTYRPSEAKEERVKPPVDRNSVYDANYRVINPPYRGSDKTDSQNTDEDDWI